MRGCKESQTILKKPVFNWIDENNFVQNIIGILHRLRLILTTKHYYFIATDNLGELSHYFEIQMNLDF